jgi:HNH endonuclease/NUMOD4 motif
MTEEWRPITGLEGRYEVSDRGRVRSLRNNRGRPRTIPYVRRLHRGAGGYAEIIVLVAGRSVHFLVHRLVLEAFDCPCPDGMECAHLNGDKNDNHLGNLRWATPKENAADRDRHGTTARGIRGGQARLTEDQVVEIRRRAPRATVSQLSREYGISCPSINAVIHGRTWRHVSIEGVS